MESATKSRGPPLDDSLSTMFRTSPSIIHISIAPVFIGPELPLRRSPFLLVIATLVHGASSLCVKGW